MKIYGADLSAPVIKVKLVANALGIKYDYEYVKIAEGQNRTEEYKKLHPAGKIPAMDDDGFVLFESNAICRYMADKVGSDLYPRDLKQRAKIDQWIDFSSIHIGGAVGRVLYNKFIAPKFNLEVDEVSMKCGYEFLKKFLPVVDEQLGKSTYIAGDKVSLADYILLANLDPTEAAEVNISQYPNLHKWREQLKSQEAYQKIHKFYGEEMMAQS